MSKTPRPHAPQSGPWTEQYTSQTPDGVESENAVMDCALTFEEDEGTGALAVDGAGDVGGAPYVIEGSFDRATGVLRFRKTYEGGDRYVYVGQWKDSEFAGRWRLLNGSLYGRFALKPGAMADFDASASGVQALFRRKAQSWQALCGVDLEAVRFDGEKEMLSLLLADEAYVQQLQAFHGRKDANDDSTLASGTITSGRTRLDARLMPGLFAVLDRCKAALGLKARVELFCINDAALTAMVTTTSDHRIVIDVTAGAIDALDDAEMAYVIGHELGHAVLGHLDTIRVDAQSNVGVTSLRSFALKRYQELSADRMGLLCCPDLAVALRAEMMFTTGVRKRSALGDPLAFLEYARARIEEVHKPKSAAEGLDTHPYGELRAVAIALFHQSKTFHDLAGERGGSLSEEALESQVRAIVKLMNPSVLDVEVEREDVAEFVLLGAIAVAEATRGTSKSEARVLAKLSQGYRKLYARLREMPLEDQQLRIVELAEVLALTLPFGLRAKLIDDLVLVARADGRVSQKERQAIDGVAELLGLDGTAVESALESTNSRLD